MHIPPRPAIPDYLDIACDDPQCGKTYTYAAPEIFRWSGDLTLLAPHPLFDRP